MSRDYDCWLGWRGDWDIVLLDDHCHYEARNWRTKERIRSDYLDYLYEMLKERMA